MFRTLLSATLAVAVLGGAAEAASKHKHHTRTVRTAPVAMPYIYPAPWAVQTGPLWAGPNQCFTDEGYGRFTPCDVGRSSR